MFRHFVLFVLLTGAIAGNSQIAAAQETVLPTYEVVDLNNGEDLVLARAHAIDLTAVPILPVATITTKSVFSKGMQINRNPHVVSKVGDCNSTEWLFLQPFAQDQYSLGEFAELQNTVNWFAPSFALRTYAAHNGLNVHAVRDPTWANPSVCQTDESPLLCEYRLHNPAIAVIMFGTNDMVVLTPQQFDHSLRRIIIESIEAGVIPLVSTFPRHLSFPERSILFNQIVVRAALDYNVPLINLWLALEPLPNHGIAEDNFHLTGPLTRAADLNQPNLQTGYPMRNLITLQAIDIIWREVITNQGNDSPVPSP
jgi:hypothetical protein